MLPYTQVSNITPIPAQRVVVVSKIGEQWIVRMAGLVAPTFLTAAPMPVLKTEPREPWQSADDDTERPQAQPSIAVTVGSSSEIDEILNSAPESFFLVENGHNDAYVFTRISPLAPNVHVGGYPKVFSNMKELAKYIVDILSANTTLIVA
jgi:hypothetical protein